MTDLIGEVYDILAQNDVEQSVKDSVTELIDHVDYEHQKIVLKASNGKEYELHLVATYAPKKSVFDMHREEFIEELYVRTSPDMILEHAPDIYEYMEQLFSESCGDSTLREWAFEWASMKLDIPYKVIYDRWLGL